MALLIILMALIAIVVVKYCLHMRKMENYVGNIPFAPVSMFLPFLGNVLTILQVKSTTDVHNKAVEIFEKVDTPSKLYVGPYLQINLDKPDDIKAVLTSSACLNRPNFFRFLPDILQGLITIEC